MATIILTSYMVRHPLGGVIASNMQLVWGFMRLGHEVYVFEPAGYARSCFDPIRYDNTDDCAYGFSEASRILNEGGAPGRLCFVDAAGLHHGLSRTEFQRTFRRCDLFIDRGDHRVWSEESARVPVRVLIDPDPGYRQIKLYNDAAKGIAPPAYDAYYTYGARVADGSAPAPSAGLAWRHLFHPVDAQRLRPRPPVAEAPFTTVMNWRSHKPVQYAGVSYGMKDVEFGKFAALPRLTSAPLEVAVEGRNIPVDFLREQGWRVRNAVEASLTLDRYLDYIRNSAGEFSVVKEVYRAMAVGWFSDRSAAYLALGRPVVIEDNGLEGLLPSGEGLFLVNSVEEAAEAISRVRAEPQRHALAARRLAVEHLDAEKVLSAFLSELGLPARGRPPGVRRRPTSSTPRAVRQSGGGEW